MNLRLLPLEIESEIYQMGFCYDEDTLVNYSIEDENFLKQFFENNCFIIKKIDWENVFYQLKQFLWTIELDDPIVQNMMTIIEKLENNDICFNNYSVLLSNGNVTNCIYQILLEKSLYKRIFKIIRNHS